MRTPELQKFLNASIPPKELTSAWLQGAAEAVAELVRSSRSGEIILYTNVGQAYVHSVLAPVDKVTPPDSDDLLRSYAQPDSHWAIEHVSGGGKPDRIYLSDPLDSPGCNSLVGGEQLVFRRSFTGVDKGPTRTELSQRLIQALDLYWLDEEKAYCRLNSDGDVEGVVRVLDVISATGEAHGNLVTINAEQLHRYMAVTDTALLMKFDFTRVHPGSFSGWSERSQREHRQDDLCYNSGVQSNASYANGFLIVRPLLTKQMMIDENRRDWEDPEKQYATFKAQDWKNDRLAEISCAPTALASYFEKDSPLPFQTTPAFFNPEVLQRYKADPEKYALEHRSLHSRAGWYLETFDVNDAGQVHTYLCYLAKLPYKEQLYWQAFNEWPKAPISRRAYETDFEGNFSTIPDPLENLKYAVSKLDSAKPDWWKPRGAEASAVLHYPLTASPEEWANAILALDQFIVEGLVSKALKGRLVTTGKAVDKEWGSIRLLQECLVVAGIDEDDAAEIIEPLKRTHFLRTKVKGHLTPREKIALIKDARGEHGSLAAQFRTLVGDVHASLSRVVDLL